MRERQLFFRVVSILLLVVASCKEGPEEGERYSNPELWYDSGNQLDQQLADVFYVLPTAVYDVKDSTGAIICRQAILTDSTHRARMERSFIEAESIFADSANFFAPYYRQISLDVWQQGRDSVDKFFPSAMSDVRAAFDYYLETWNGGRPFVLAGYSQGGRAVVELLKEMDSEIFSRMVAAYVCGYSVTEDDIAIAPEHFIAPRDSSDTGVVIVYNTVSDLSAVSPIISGRNVMVTNPASWVDDNLPHHINDTVSVRIDTVARVLVAEGFDPATVYREKFDPMIPFGNLHMAELSLYEDALRRNVKQRISAFGK